jgi:hypothetical protein
MEAEVLTKGLKTASPVIAFRATDRQLPTPCGHRRLREAAVFFSPIPDVKS